MKAGASNFFQSGIRFFFRRFLRPVLSFWQEVPTVILECLGGDHKRTQMCWFGEGGFWGFFGEKWWDIPPALCLVVEVSAIEPVETTAY